MILRCIIIGTACVMLFAMTIGYLHEPQHKQTHLTYDPDYIKVLFDPKPLKDQNPELIPLNR